MPEKPNKFARMLQTAREHQSPTASETDVQPEEQPKPQAKPASTEPKGRGRPATGKRSDPDYESTTVFLRKETKTAAARLLVGEKRQDLSDVLEKLLSGWVHRNS